MRWLVIAFALFASAALVSAPASAERKGSPSAQAKAAAKAQKAEAKRVLTAAKAEFKKDLPDAKARLKSANADLKAQQKQMKNAQREELRRKKALDKAFDRLNSARRAERGNQSDENSARVQAAQADVKTAQDEWSKATRTKERMAPLLSNARSDFKSAAKRLKILKSMIKTGPPPEGAPVFNSNGALPPAAVANQAYAVAPALGAMIIGKAPASGPVAPLEPRLPISPAPASGPVAPPEPPSPSANAAPKAPPEPPLSRAALTVARAESPYQIIPMGVFKQKAAAQ